MGPRTSSIDYNAKDLVEGARLHENQGAYLQAGDLYKEAAGVVCITRGGSRLREAWLLKRAASCYKRAGDAAEAIRLSQRAETLREECLVGLVARTYGIIGNTAYDIWGAATRLRGWTRRHR